MVISLEEIQLISLCGEQYTIMCECSSRNHQQH